MITWSRFHHVLPLSQVGDVKTRRCHKPYLTPKILLGKTERIQIRTYGAFLLSFLIQPTELISLACGQFDILTN